MNEIIADLGLPEEAAERILRGQMVHDEPEESSERELAVGLAFLVQQPPTEVLKAFLSELDLRSDPKLAASVAIVGPGTPEDFAGLVLQPNGSAEAMRYLSASPGEALNLSPEEIRAFNALASAGGDPKTEVEGRLKRLMLRRYQAYLAKGLLGIAPYARSNGLFDDESCRKSHRSFSSCWSRIHKAGLRALKRVSTGFAMTVKDVRTTRCGIGWRWPYGRTLSSPIASST